MVKEKRISVVDNIYSAIQSVSYKLGDVFDFSPVEKETLMKGFTLLLHSAWGKK
jgi:hypothetical protein